MATSIWNLSHPLRSGFVPLVKGGRELFGTVIRHGRMKKTCTVIKNSLNFRSWWLVTATIQNTKCGLKKGKNSIAMTKKNSAELGTK